MAELLKILPGRLRNSPICSPRATSGPHPGHRLPGPDRLHGLGITGPVLRSTGLPHDLRKSQPYCGYETYDFDVITDTARTAAGAT